MRSGLTTAELISQTLDAGSWISWDRPLNHRPASFDYAHALQRAREASGSDESVITGEGTIRGRRVAIVASEFQFLAGSLGLASVERLVVAIRRATAEGLPLLASPASGGTRMQEGTPAFVQMLTITAAIEAHKRAKLPYLVYLRHPTTGGVMASWGSLGHLTAAEPGALLGFLGPRVYAALHSRRFPDGVQTAENLLKHGLIDAVVPPHHLAEVLERILSVLDPPRLEMGKLDKSADSPLPTVDDWESVRRSRRPDRPGVRELLRYAATDAIRLSGTGAGEAESGLVLALVQFGRIGCVLVGQDRQRQVAGYPLGPGALRGARRGMQLAEDLNLPLVLVIDTPGAALSAKAEEGGLAGEIARCLADLIAVETPTLAILMGQGTGGAALALLPADRIIGAQHAWLAPLPPEAASALMYRDVSHASDMARTQRVGSFGLHRTGILDRIVPEHPDAADEPERFCAHLGQVLRYELSGLLQRDPATRLEQRIGRFEWIAPAELAQFRLF